MTLSVLLTLRQKVKHRLLTGLAPTIAECRLRLTGQRPTRLLLASDLRDYTSEEQYHPFASHAAALARDLGLTVWRTDIAMALAHLRAQPGAFDVVGFKLSFRTSEVEALTIARAFRAATTAPLICFDGDDDICVGWPSVLAEVDLWVKKHLPRARSDLTRATVGKTNLTDYAHRTQGVSFADDIIPTRPGTPPDLIPKVRLLASIGLDAKIDALRQKFPTLPQGPRPVDVVCRATVNPASWLFHLRKGVVPALEPLKQTHTLLLPTEKVSQDQYYAELLGAKICVSPFGYGEICWRDFEAVVCGAVIVKPDMQHVETRPDIFHAGVTYLPCKWDFSDLAQVCADALADPDRLNRIATTAHAALTDYVSKAQFVSDLRGLLTDVAVRLKPAGPQKVTTMA